MRRAVQRMQPVADVTVEMLLENAPRSNRALRDRLPEVVRRLSEVIASARRRQELPALDRPALGRLFRRLSEHMPSVAADLETLAAEPSIELMRSGPEGVFRPLGDVQQLAKMLQFAGIYAGIWRERMRGSGRHTPADLVDKPTPELLVAVGLARIFQELQLPPLARNDDGCALCESLWLGAGAPASKSISRWKGFIAQARGQRPTRPGALALARLAVDGCLLPGDANALAEARALAEFEKH